MCGRVKLLRAQTPSSTCYVSRAYHCVLEMGAWSVLAQWSRGHLFRPMFSDKGVEFWVGKGKTFRL